MNNRRIIDLDEFGKETAKRELCFALDEWLASDRKEKLTIKLEHIVSADFEEMFDVADEKEFNGWQCDWWGKMDYHGYTFKLFGEAWYGGVTIKS